MTSTVISTTTLLAGESATVRVEPQPGGDTLLTVTLDQPDLVAQTPARQPLLVGMEGPLGTQTDRIISSYPGLEYMREFGTKRTGETLPSLPGWTASKLATMPPTCRPHVSWKYWDTTRQAAWLDSRPMASGPGYWPELDTTYWHEPHGDIDPATYRSRGSSWAQMVKAHPNGGGITTGPIITRYWLMGGGNPLDWWYPEADFYGLDTYEPTSSTGQVLPSADLFGPALEKLYAALPDGVAILVPEMGRRYGAGQARADALAADVEYLRTQHPRVRVVSYFNSSSFPEFAFAGSNAATSPDAGASTPEGQAWKAALAA